MYDLRQLFASLPPPPASASGWPMMSAVQLPRHPRLRIARDRHDRALLLVDTESEAEPSVVPLVLENLRIEPARPCQLHLPDGSAKHGVFTIVLCTSGDAVLREHFLLVLGTLVEAIALPPTPQRMTAAINWVVELFRALQAPPRKAVQGLWAEVFLVAESTHPEVLLRSWHVNPEDRYDFSFEAVRVEVKSVGGAGRQHHFSLAQLSPPKETLAIVVSIRVERAGGGLSLGDLLAELRDRLGGQPDLLLRLEMVVASTLGASLTSSLRERFDREVARNSVAYYNAADVPCVPGPIPAAVTDVRFRSDLSTIQAVDPHEERPTSGIGLLAALP